jgi:epoxide hydrolase-like predicted phosphatase
MEIRAVIFDIGGVLLDVHDWGIMRKWDQRLALPEGSFRKRLYASGIPYAASLGKLSIQTVRSEISSLFGISNASVQEFMDDLWSQFTLNMELATFLRSLRPRYKTATLSNDWPGAREEEHQRFNLDEIIQVDEMVFSSEEGMRKPQEEFYLLVCQRLGVKPSEAIFLDNTSKMVKAACHLGRRGIEFESNTQAIAEVLRCLKFGRCSLFQQ